MHSLPARCPICGGELVVTSVQCRVCDTRIEGRFAPKSTVFAALDAEQLAFLEVFLRCEGKLNCVGDRLGLSYPTVRNRLRALLATLGFEPDETEAEEDSAADDALRQQVLDDLEAGRITAEEALRLLEGGQ